MNSLSILNRGFRDVNLLLCGWEDCESGHSFGPTSREYYLFHYILSGEGCFYRNGSEYRLAAGQMFLINPGEVTFYEADTEKPWSYIWVGFDGSRCGELIDSSPFSNGRCAADVAYLGGLFSQLRSHGNLSTGAELFVLSGIYEMFALMKERSSAGGGDYVRRAEDFMRANYAVPITIQEIAAMMKIDRRYLCRIFAAQKGLPPKEFLTGIRLEKAMAMLDSTSLTVGEIARSVGYDDQFSFSKLFKKKTGLSPGEYRGGGLCEERRPSRSPQGGRTSLTSASGMQKE